MNRTYNRILPVALALLVLSSSWAEEEKRATPVQSRLFTAESFLEHVKYLASDELEGRLPGSPGSAAAAAYIIKHFEAAGCKRAGEDNSWYQPFDIFRGKRLADEKAALAITGLERAWKVREDWITFPFSETEDVEGPLAFAGYGIHARSHDYNDYAEFDAAGKILLIFRYEPKDADPEAKFGGESPSKYATFVRKARTADREGAKALLIVNPPNRNPDADQLYGFDSFDTNETYHLPMAHISREMAAAILKAAGAPDLKTLQEQLDRDRKPLSRDLGLTVRFAPGVERNVIPGKNILARLPGDGSTEDTIVLGAHRDHLGKVPRQFQRADKTPMIHNGADDNASGSAALLELARVLTQGPRLHRNILLISFDAEEMGLLGSQHYVEHPTIALESIRAIVNFDMIGRLKQKKYSVFGTATAKEFPALVKKYAEQCDLKYLAPGGMAGGSDHTPFIRRQIPGMFPFTGIHKDYHQPEDDWELIDAEGAARVLEMWHAIIVELANMEDGPAYTDPTLQPMEDEAAEDEVIKPAVEENREYQQKVEQEEDADDESDEPPSRTGLRVRLGIIPDMAGDGKPGMVVQSVLDGGPAKLAGLRDNDRIMKIGEDRIRDIYGYMRTLRLFKPGDKVDVVVIRDDQEQTFTVTLQPAQQRRGDE
ncbi:MAG: M28 family peptidase [Planctomycetes bacterium]|nr:M28 family peptidase [Planctomycetota bacterium]